MSDLPVLWVIDSLGRSGTERSMAELLPHLAAAGIRPVIACLRRSTEGVEPEVQRQGFDVRLVEQSGLGPRAWAIRELIRAEQPALVHTALLAASLAGRLAAWRTGAPVLTSLVNTPYAPVRRLDPGISPAKLAVVRWIDGWTARRLTAHFHAVSHAVKAAAVRDLGVAAERITVVERGRDPARLGAPGAARRAAARGRLGLPDEAKLILNVGRQEYQKGQEALLRAFALLAPRRPELLLWIAGRAGNMSFQLAQLRQSLGLEEQVSFLGHRNDVPELLAAADLFVFPSLFEGMPGAVIEAMALGLPVVASDIAPNREVVEEGHNALLVLPSPEALAAASERLLDDPALAAAFGAASRQIFEERFTLERSAAGMVALYRRVAEMRS